MSTAAAPAPVPAPSTYDINARVDELFAEHGFAKTDTDGDIVRDKLKVVDRLVDILLTEALVENADERVEKAMGKPSLYDTVFQNGPSFDDPDEVERAVAEYVATYVWSMTSPSSDGRVQRELATRAGTTDVMLCRRKVGRVPSVYVTRTDELIVEDFVTPSSEKIVNAADKTKRDMNMVAFRRPSLEARVKRELESMAIKTSIALGVATSAPALESGQ